MNSAPAVTPADEKVHRVVLRQRDAGAVTFTVHEGEHILDRALAAGIDLPYSCLQGWCLTCAARLVEGEVDQHDSRRYFPEDKEAGFVLLCTGRARSDLVLEPFARDAMRRARDVHGLPYPRGDWGRG